MSARSAAFGVAMRKICGVVALVWALGGCQAAIYGTAADFNRVQLGMSRADVVAILGEPLSHGADAGGERLIYKRMEYTLGWAPTIYQVVLKDGVVAQFGERP